MMNRPFVIGICSISGGGKSTIVQALSAHLEESTIISFDDYTTAETYPKDFDAWAANEFDLNEIQAPLLAQHLSELRAGKSIQSPTDGRPILPEQYILFEAPLGRAQEATGQHIDYLVFIDTPLELGFARMIKRLTALEEVGQQTVEDLEAQVRGIDEAVDGYIRWTRDAYRSQREQVVGNCDLVLDGSLSVDKITQSILETITSAKNIVSK
jgi:uridine kinase